MKTKVLFCILLALAGCKNNNDAIDEIITLGTFNMEWLGDGINDNKYRNDTVLQQIAGMLELSGIELIGVQEVENEAAAQSIISKMDGFNFKLSKHNSKQKVGVFYNDDELDVEVVGDYNPLILEAQGYNMRPGFIVNVSKNSFEMVVMVVHLKSTSRYDSTAELKELSRQMRTLQASIINKWVDSILQTNPQKKIAIIGDFNDFPNRKHNRTLDELTTNPKLHFLTKEQKSCKFKFNYSIDHILISNGLKQNYIDNSIFLLDINSMLNENEVENVSDHCPVSVQFKTSSN